MNMKAAFANLKSQLHSTRAANGYYLQGVGEVHLSDSDFKARGGEGSVYVKGSTAYKIYADPQRMIPQTKLDELSVLTEPDIIRPLRLLLDGSNRPVGYSMRHVTDAYALCQLFPKAFRQRKNLAPDTVFKLVQRFREGVSHVHAKGILIVDLNEMNFLVSEDFARVYFIDVDSYQTPSHPATALMESVRDRHAVVFDANSDWFSFAVVSFQMFVGIHPFKGTYPPLQDLADKERRLDERMRAHISVLHAGVTTPASCLPFQVIPPAYLDWYRAVFEEGKRLPPPTGAQQHIHALVSPQSAPQPRDGSLFEITEWREFDGEIIRHDGPVTITERSVYFDGKRYPKPSFEIKALITPRGRRLVIAYLDGGRLRFRDLTQGQDLASGLDAEELATSGGRLCFKQRENLCEIEFIETARSVLPGSRVIGSVMMKATRLFEGVAIQNLLGAHYASILTAPGLCRQARLRELDGYQALDAKMEGGVLFVVAAQAGRYDRFIFRFAADFGDYDVRCARDITPTGINFTALESGVVLHLNDEDALEIFSSRKGSTQLSVLTDPALRSDAKLFRHGSQALFARGDKLYKLKMRPPSQP